MNYEVYNENNVAVIVTDEQLEEAMKQNAKEISIEILDAMSMARQSRFSPYLCNALYHNKLKARIKAIYGLLSLLDQNNVPALKEKEQSISEDDMYAPISEKAILQAVLIRLEKGPEGAYKAFFKGDIPPLVKTLLLHNYFSDMPLSVDDIKFIVDVLEAYLNKTEPWMHKMKQDEYEDDIIAPFEGLMREAEESTLLNNLPSELNEKLIKIGRQILKMKIDSYAKECIATFAKGLPPKVAYLMLEPIMDGSARGDVRKELNKTLKVLRQKEQNEVNKDVHGA